MIGDASVLLIPLMGLLPADDPKVISTVRAIERRLILDGLVYRFDPQALPQPTGTPLGEREAAFLPCTFWIAAVYAMLGEHSRAERILDRVEKVAGEVGLFAEGLDRRTNTYRGNMPLLFSHAEYLRAVIESAKERPITRLGMIAGQTLEGRAYFNWRHVRAADVCQSERATVISVIVPVLNEMNTIAPLIRALARESAAHETIFVDGGSTDGSAEMAIRMGARVVLSDGGRGNQICRGVDQSSGDTLLFLHADSVFPSGGLARIFHLMNEHPDLVGGNFRLIFDGQNRFSRWLTAFYGWIRLFGLYYGDSGIFVRRSVYNAIGGIRPIPLMEDLDFTRRLERFGKTCRIEDLPLITSSRRFDGRHPTRIVFGWIALHVLFWCGVAPDRLARIYAKQQPSTAALSQSRGEFDVRSGVTDRFLS